MIEPESKPPVAEVAREVCEYCGMDALEWRKCKQICAECGQINRSCADL